MLYTDWLISPSAEILFKLEKIIGLKKKKLMVGLVGHNQRSPWNSPDPSLKLIVLVLIEKMKYMLNVGILE